jgi:hypothetical protein
MSPDDTVATETGPAPDAAEAAPKKSIKERLQFLGKGGEKMDKVPVFNKIPKSMRLIVVLLIVVVLIVAFVGIGMMGGDDKPPTPNGKTINPAKLDDWSWPSGVLSQSLLNEGTTQTFSIGGMLPANGTMLVDFIEVTITWQDEPDGSVGPRQKTNEPDTFQLEVNSSANVSGISQETSNSHGSSQSITLSVDVGASGFSYLALGNVSDVKLPPDVVVSDLNVMVHMIVAGDHHSSPEIVYINDFGNDYSIEITLSGKVIPA